jgi:hypothetical protein
LQLCTWCIHYIIMEEASLLRWSVSVNRQQNFRMVSTYFTQLPIHLILWKYNMLVSSFSVNSYFLILIWVPNLLYMMMQKYVWK